MVGACSAKSEPDNDAGNIPNRLIPIAGEGKKTMNSSLSHQGVKWKFPMVIAG
jgi:hypothetical protein